MIGKKNLRLLAVLIGLILASVGLSLWDSSSSTSFDSQKFALEDINHIDRIVMTRAEEVLDCRAFTEGFLINDTYAMDQSLLAVLGAVLQQVRVQRPVSEKQEPALWQRLRAEGTHVQVYAGEQILASFWAGGDENKERSYYATDEGAVFLVILPGYTDYVSGLFERGLEDWRSKNIFQNTWRSILSFTLEDFENPENNFRIDYSDPFFTVPGIQNIDSNRVVGYLDNLRSLRAQTLVDTSYQGKPWIKLTATDINPQKNLELTLYPADSLVLGKANERYVMIPRRQIEPFLRNTEYFSRQD